MAKIRRIVNYSVSDTEFASVLVYDDTAENPRAAIMVNPTWAGCDEFARTKAEAIARLGYVALAVDVYGGGRVGSGPEENAALMQPLLENRGALLERMRAALAALRTQPEVAPARIAAMGFCFGGLCVLDLARSGADVLGVASFHGLLHPPPPEFPRDAKISAKVLLLHGHDDPLAPMGQVSAIASELTQAGADWQCHLYGNTRHAFTNPNANDPIRGTVYNADAERYSWRAFEDFMTEVLN